MPTYIVGFDGKWQEQFDELEPALEWAKEVAETGRTVEVVSRRFGFHKFVTGFPDSEREALRARWKTPLIPWASDNLAGSSSGEAHYNSAYGGHAGDGGGHGGHGGH